MDVLKELLETIKNNSIDNKCTIENVDLFVKSWTKEAESLQLRKTDVMARFSSEYLHTSIKNLLFAKQYEQLTFDEKMKELMQLLYSFEQEQWEQGFKNGYNASIKDSQKNYDERFSK